MDQRIIELFDEYTHKPLSRKLFLKRLAVLTGSTTAALSVLPLLEANYASAATVSDEDEDLVLENISYPGDGTTMKGYFAKPSRKGKYGSVVVIHENRGLNPHIRDIVRRIAKEGYLAMAPDALSPFGGTPENEDQARALFSKLDQKRNLNNFLNALDYMKGRPQSNGRTGCLGFCWGGGLANQLAVHAPDLKACVAYYGMQPDAEDVPKIKAAVQLHYAGLDERINKGITAYETALKAAGTRYELYLYEGVNHAFNNDTSPARYNEPAAKLAWQRTLRLFGETLR